MAEVYAKLTDLLFRHSLLVQGVGGWFLVVLSYLIP